MVGPPVSTSRNGPHPSRRRLLRTAVAAGALGIVGCLDSDAATSGMEGSELEVFHRWISPAEGAAIDAVIEAFEDAHPHLDADFRANSGDTPYPEVIGNRLDHDDPPSSFACRPGRNLERYRSHLGGIADDVWRETKLPAVSVSEVRELCRLDGERLAVPVSAYRTNLLFYNVRVVEDAGVDPNSLSALPDLLDALDRVAATTDATPMAHALQGPWTELQLFGAVLLGQEGADAYATFVAGEGADGAVRRSFETVETILSNYVGDDARSTTSTGAIDAIANDEAAFLQQGSWAATDFREAEFSYGEDWGSVAFPGTGGTFTLYLDAFVSPVDDAGVNPSPLTTDAWLRHVAAPGQQQVFNAHRGSVPIRTDVSTAPFDPFLAAQTEDFRTADRRPPSLAHGLAVAPERLSAMESVVAEHFADPFDVDATTEGLLDAANG